MKKISFWILLAIAVLIVVGGANSQTKIPGSRIQDGAIDTNHFSDNVMALIMFNGDTAAVTYSVVDGRLTLVDFNTASRDSLKHGLVKYADTSGVTLTVGKDALNDTLQFIASLRNIITGRTTPPWIYKVQRASESDSTIEADHAKDADIADSVRGGVNQDTVNVSLIAIYAQTAGTVIASDTTVGVGAVTWNSFASALKTMIKSDSVVRAMRADSLSANSIDSYGMFHSDIKTGYLPTNAEKLALRSTGTPGTANPYTDSTYVRNNYVLNLEGSARPIQFDLAATPTTVYGNVTSVTIDTVHGRLIFKDMDSTRWVFEDSTVIRALITSSLADYVLKGTGGGPARFTVAAATPSGGSDLDAWINTNDTTLNVKISGSWVEVASGGGGGGTPTSVSTDAYGVIDADSLIFNKYNASEFPVTSPLVITQSLTVANNADLYAYGDIQADTIKGHTSNRFYIASTDTILGDFQIGRANASPSNGAQPDGYFDSLTVGTLKLTSNNPLTLNNDLMPATTNHGFLGSSVAQWSRLHSNSVVSEYFSGQNPYHFIYGQNDTILISPDEVQGVKFRNVAVGVYNNDLTVSSGSIVQSGAGSISGAQIAAGGTSITSDGITLSSPDSLTVTSGSSIRVQSTGNIIVRSGGEIRVPSDISNSFGDLTDTQQYYLMDSTQKAGVVQACPDPSSSNPFITKVWFKQMLNSGLRKEVDSVYNYRANPRNLLYFKSPGCDDSLYMGYGNVGIVWPQDSTIVPIEFPDTLNKLVLPYNPWIIPLWPVGIDTTSHGIFSAFPHEGISEGKMQVSERYDSRFGNYTGLWPTIQFALDSLINVRCALNSDLSSAVQSNPDTFRIASRTSGSGLTVYHGDVAQNSTAILDTLPDFLREPGIYVRFEKANNDTNRWCQIQRWINDSTFTVLDPVLGSGGGLTSGWTCTFAKKSNIEVLPPITGGFVDVSTVITIGDWCPVRITGTHKSEVKISNRTNTAVPTTQQIFKTAGTTDADVYFGMPIEFANMTVFSDSGATPSNAFNLFGNILFEDCNFIFKSTVAAKGAIHIVKNSGCPISTQAPSVIVDRCLFVADSDMAIFNIEADSTMFQSSSSSYSVSGDSGSVIVARADLRNAPYFIGDVFFFGLSGTHSASVARLCEATVTQNLAEAAIVKAVGCTFIGIDPASGSGNGEGFILQGGWDEVVGGSFYDAAITMAPPKLRDSALPIKVPYSPK